MTNLTITGNGNFPINSIGFGREFSVAVSGTFGSGTIKAQYATAGPVAATEVVDDDTETGAFTLTAKNPGTAGNSYTFAIGDPAESQALAITQTGLDFVVTPACDAGDAAAVTTAMTGTNNDITITADTAGTIGNGYSIELLAGSGTTQALSVTTSDNLKFSVTLARAADAISTTATQLVAALNAYAPFAALMTAAVKSGDNGSGVVTALAETDLTGGGANAAITTTSAELVALLNASAIVTPHFSAALKAAYDGAGLIEPLAESAFTGGTAGTFVDFSGDNAISFTAAGQLIGTNVGMLSTINLNVAGSTTPSITAIVTELPE
jgi:hypothetical protein